MHNFWSSLLGILLVPCGLNLMKSLWGILVLRGCRDGNWNSQMVPELEIGWVDACVALPTMSVVPYATGSIINPINWSPMFSLGSWQNDWNGQDWGQTLLGPWGSLMNSAQWPLRLFKLPWSPRISLPGGARQGFVRHLSHIRAHSLLPTAFPFDCF